MVDDEKGGFGGMEWNPEALAEGKKEFQDLYRYVMSAYKGYEVSHVKLRSAPGCAVLEIGLYKPGAAFVQPMVPQE